MELEIALAALSILKQVYPVIAEQLKSGQISPEDQQKFLALFEDLRNQGAFTGPEWEVK